MPELFFHEINRLDAKDRERFSRQRLTYTRADGEQLEVDAVYGELDYEQVDSLFARTMTMEMYLLE